MRMNSFFQKTCAALMLAAFALSGTAFAAELADAKPVQDPKGFSAASLGDRERSAQELIQNKSDIADLSAGLYRGSSGLFSKYLTADSQEEFDRNVRYVSRNQKRILERELARLEREEKRRKEREEREARRSSRTAARVSTMEVARLGPQGTTEVQGVVNWIKYNQSQSPLGLVQSYVGSSNSALNYQAFTYDQALAGIALIQSGDTASAKKIFDFYNSQWTGNGFYNVYNTLSANGSKLEWYKFLGPNSWMGIFCVKYYEATGDTSAFKLALKIADWARTALNDNGAAVAQASEFPNTFSVEENLDYNRLCSYIQGYAANFYFLWQHEFGVLTGASLYPNNRKRIFSSGAEAHTAWLTYQGEYSRGLNWLLDQRFADKTFRRGPGGDFTKALDSNSWAFISLTPYYMDAFYSYKVGEPHPLDVRDRELPREIDKIIAAAENAFLVQPNNTFGGNFFTSKGFDFSDAINASIAGRAGVKWLEGTSQMIVTYKALARYYGGSGGDRAIYGPVASKAAYYQARADYLIAQQEQHEIWDGTRLSFAYADRANVKVWHDNPWFYTSDGSSVAATAWAYFAYTGNNPY